MSSVRTPIAILSFPHLFSPRPRAPGGEPVFSCSLLFDQAAQKHPDFAALITAMNLCIDEEWGIGKSRDKAFLGTIRRPFRRAQDKAYKGYDIPNGLYISPWSKSRPGLVDAQRNEISVPDDVWAGQLARATVAAFAYSTSGNKGVSFALNNIQICRTDGERLDGRRAAREEFDDYDGPGALVGAGVDDDMPF